MAKKNMDMMESGAKVKLGVSDVIIRGFGYVFITLYAVCCIVPFIIIISTSFTDQSVIRTQGHSSYQSSSRCRHMRWCAGVAVSGGRIC